MSNIARAKIAIALGMPCLLLSAAAPRAFATAGAGFIASGPADVPYIAHGTTSVYNLDTKSEHWVYASLGQISVANPTINLSGWANSETRKCAVYSLDEKTNVVHTDEISFGQKTGNFTASKALTIPRWQLLSVTCNLGKASSSGSPSIYSVSATTSAVSTTPLAFTTFTTFGSLGGLLTAAPSVSSPFAGRLDVYARGGDNNIWHTAKSGTSWGGWENQGAPPGGANGSPASASWGPGRDDIFVLGTDNHVWHKSYDSSSGWSSWQDRGGPFTSDPGCNLLGTGTPRYLRPRHGRVDHAPVLRLGLRLHGLALARRLVHPVGAYRSFLEDLGKHYGARRRFRRGRRQRPLPESLCRDVQDSR